MRVKKMNKLVMLTVLVPLFLCPASALAVPSLGVVPTDGGFYFGPPPEYLSLFNITATSNGGDPSAMMPSSGGLLTVWYGEDNGILTSGADIFLATNCSSGDDFDFDGRNFYDLESTHTAAGYKPLPYYGVNLGPVWIDADSDGVIDSSEIREGWEEVDHASWPGTFYTYEGTINYSDFGEGDWMFAMADMDGAGVEDLMLAMADMDGAGVFTNGKDIFSPRTTSSTVPEPATMLLLGTGLIGLAGLGRKRFRKG